MLKTIRNEIYKTNYICRVRQYIYEFQLNACLYVYVISYLVRSELPFEGTDRSVVSTQTVHRKHFVWGLVTEYVVRFQCCFGYYQ